MAFGCTEFCWWLQGYFALTSSAELTDVQEREILNLRKARQSIDPYDRAVARGHYLRSVVDSMYHKFSLRFAAQMAEAEAFIEKLNTSLASHLVDTDVVEKLNAGLKSYHERDAGEKHA